MTLLQREIQKRSKVIAGMGDLMITGSVSITADNESLLQRGFVALLELNEKDMALQENILKDMRYINAK